MIMSYKNLDIWKLAGEVSIEIHKINLDLPRFELFETGSQIRRSSKSVRSNIVEGYGRRRYKQDYIRFITYALASNDETIDHLKSLFETGSLKDEYLYNNLLEQLNILGKMINSFLCTVQSGHNSP